MNWSRESPNDVLIVRSVVSNVITEFAGTEYPEIPMDWIDPSGAVTVNRGSVIALEAVYTFAMNPFGTDPRYWTAVPPIGRVG